MTGGDYYLKFALQQRGDGPATLLLLASQSVGLFCSVCLAQCLFEGFLMSPFFHISQNMESKNYLLLKEQVVLCEAAFPLLSLLVKFRAVILIDHLMQFKRRVLSRYF